MEERGRCKYSSVYNKVQIDSFSGQDFQHSPFQDGFGHGLSSRGKEGRIEVKALISLVTEGSNCKIVAQSSGSHGFLCILGSMVESAHETSVSSSGKVLETGFHGLGEVYPSRALDQEPTAMVAKGGFHFMLHQR